MSAGEILCPRCPVRDQPPMIAIVGLVQWFCGTDGCVVLCWDPYETLEENLMKAVPVKVIDNE